MRPKRHVLLYGPDYDLRNDLAFVLRVRCPWARIETFHTLGEMDEAITEGQEFDCIVLMPELDIDRGRQVAEDIDRSWLMRTPEVALRAVEIFERKDVARVSLAGRRVLIGHVEPLIEAMRMVCVRKRGPKGKAADVAAAQAVA